MRFRAANRLRGLVVALSLALLAAGLLSSCGGDDDESGPGQAGGGGGSPADSGSDQDATGLDAADVSDTGQDSSMEDSPPDAQFEADAEADAPPLPCPTDMSLVGSTCVDLYEAPNRADALPLVMYNLVEADAWCTARGKRLCYDDEWTLACEGPGATTYPYGDVHEPGTCNDDKTWLTYNQTSLNGWPGSVSAPSVESVEELFDAARVASAGGQVAADHVEWLYQAEPGGANPGCTNDWGVFDLCGNVEEWTLRRDGGTVDFAGNLKGRYWAESRTCQSNVTAHGDYFRFYEIGFRCCRDADIKP